MHRRLVFPAPAGMNRRGAARPGGRPLVPRTRGDEPGAPAETTFVSTRYTPSEVRVPQGACVPGREVVRLERSGHQQPPKGGDARQTLPFLKAEHHGFPPAMLCNDGGLSLPGLVDHRRESFLRVAKLDFVHTTSPGEGEILPSTRSGPLGMGFGSRRRQVGQDIHPRHEEVLQHLVSVDAVLVGTRAARPLGLIIGYPHARHGKPVLSTK